MDDRPPDEQATEDLMGAREIQAVLGVSRQRVQQIVSRPDFPRPVAELAIKVWRGEHVRAWIREHRPDITIDP